MVCYSRAFADEAPNLPGPFRDGPNTYTYTAAGQLKTKTDSNSGATTTYGWDGFGELESVDLPGTGQDVGYVLGPGGERVGKKVGGNLVQGFIYGAYAENPVAETDGQGTVTERFVYATSPYTPDYIVKDSHTYRVISDERGSVRLVVDASSGQVAERIDYDEFGRVLSDSNPGFQPFGFAGGIWDPDTGLLHLNARDYDPDTGRFISKDPIGFEGGDTNLYGYGLGDPVNMVDPSGLSFFSKISQGVYSVANALSGGSLENIACNGLNLSNGLSLGLNIGMMLMPGGEELKGAEAVADAGGEAVTLFRNVGPNELASLKDTGKFSQGGTSLGGKWFWEHEESANTFRDWNGKPHIVSIKVPKDYRDSLWNGGKSNYDGIGPARYAEDLDELNDTFWGLTLHG